MASTGRRAAHKLIAFGIGTPLSFLALFSLPNAGSGCNAVDIVTARALASVGLIGLAGLPLLMLASVMLEAPLAGPAVISLGYLAAAHALATEQSRRAAALMLMVSGGFVAWTLLSLVTREEAASGAGLAAVILAPIFAAAPALVRGMASRRPGAERLAEPQALTTGGIFFEGGTALNDGAVAEPLPIASEPPRLCVLPGSSLSVRGAVSLPPSSKSLQRPKADVQEAVGFALRHVGPKARAKGIKLVCSGDSTIAVACDRQVCRKALHGLLGEVVKVSPLGASVHILARGVRGAVLLRVSSTGPAPAEFEIAWEDLDLDAVRQMIDAIGGTLVTTQTQEGVCASLRLARADNLVRQGPGGLSSGAI